MIPYFPDFYEYLMVCASVFPCKVANCLLKIFCFLLTILRLVVVFQKVTLPFVVPLPELDLILRLYSPATQNQP